MVEQKVLDIVYLDIQLIKEKQYVYKKIDMHFMIKHMNTTKQKIITKINIQYQKMLTLLDTLLHLLIVLPLLIKINIILVKLILLYTDLKIKILL